MSLDTIRREINRFLNSETPEVLAIKGAWGVGKTFAWNRFLKKAQKVDSIKLKKYSYVSLFGIDSLDSFKFSIFEQKINANLIGTEPNLETFKENTTSVLSSLGRKTLHLFKGFSFVKSFTPVLESVSFLSLTKTLICVDDFERKGSNLSVKDILGLLSVLKEQKRCKIVLVLNDSSFEDESLKEYEKYKEKVVDIELSFNPSSRECVDIALDNVAPFSSKLRQYMILLNINNIRIIKKIERLALLLNDLLSKYEQEVLHQALHSLVLFSWSYCDKSKQVPNFDYIKNIGYRMFGIDEKKLTEKDKLWQSILSEYKYQTTDEFDLVIAQAVETGYVDEGALDEKAKKLNEQVVATQSDSSFEEAWSRYHDSFEDNEEEVLQGIYDSFKKNTKYITPMNLNGTVKLFRDLDRSDQANELIDHYIETRKDEKKLFDLDNYTFAGDIDDKIIIAKFHEIKNETKDHKTIKEVLEAIAGKGSWGSNDVNVLGSATVNDYFSLFKSEQGRKLGLWVNACLKFGRFTNPSEQYKQIASKAIDALLRIAGESKINARRVAKFGIKIDNENIE